jgi:DNA methylase
MEPYYDHAGITIYHGDCREILPTLGPVDLVLTDPPYGINHTSGQSRELWGAVSDAWGDASIKGDDDTTLRDYVIAWAGGLPCIVFGTWRIVRPVNTHTVLIWDKGANSGMGDLSIPFKPSFEEIYLIGKHGYCGSRDEGVLKGFYQPGRISMGRIHPMQKPVTLMRYLMSKTTSATILDPFMGSGTTLRAAKDLGRRAIGIEIDERYCEIAARRLSQEVFDLST